jgi:hypothetical protein
MGRPVLSTQYSVLRKRGISLLASCVLGTVYLVLAGCASEPQPAAAPDVDPLVGGPPIRPAAAPASAASAPTTAAPTARSGPAPLPAPATSTSTAALAPGSFQPLDPNHDLRIGSANPTPGGVALSRPEEATPAPPPRHDVPPAPGTVLTAATNVTTFEQAQAVLRARGVTWQRLETAGTAGEWKFSCSVPNRQDPNLGQVYEFRAADPLAAIRAVLDQIGRDQR